jgi:hypothetical protein
MDVRKRSGHERVELASDQFVATQPARATATQPQCGDPSRHVSATYAVARQKVANRDLHDS